MSDKHWKRKWDDVTQAEYFYFQGDIPYWVPIEEIGFGDISWIGKIADESWATDEILGEFVRHFHSICNLKNT